jgi:hypothetical protein
MPKTNNAIESIRQIDISDVKRVVEDILKPLPMDGNISTITRASRAIDSAQSNSALGAKTIQEIWDELAPINNILSEMVKNPLVHRELAAPINSNALKRYVDRMPETDIKLKKYLLKAHERADEMGILRALALVVLQKTTTITAYTCAVDTEEADSDTSDRLSALRDSCDAVASTGVSFDNITEQQMQQVVDAAEPSMYPSLLDDLEEYTKGEHRIAFIPTGDIPSVQYLKSAMPEYQENDTEFIRSRPEYQAPDQHGISQFTRMDIAGLAAEDGLYAFALEYYSEDMEQEEKGFFFSGIAIAAAKRGDYEYANLFFQQISDQREKDSCAESLTSTAAKNKDFFQAAYYSKHVADRIRRQYVAEDDLKTKFDTELIFNLFSFGEENAAQLSEHGDMDRFWSHAFARLRYRGVDFNDINGGMSLAHMLIEYRHENGKNDPVSMALPALLRNMDDPNQISKRFQTSPLGFAIRNNDSGAVDILLRNEVSVLEPAASFTPQEYEEMAEAKTNGAKKALIKFFEDHGDIPQEHIIPMAEKGAEWGVNGVRSYISEKKLSIQFTEDEYTKMNLAIIKGEEEGFRGYNRIVVRGREASGKRPGAYNGLEFAKTVQPENKLLIQKLQAAYDLQIAIRDKKDQSEIENLRQKLYSLLDKPD